MKGLEREIVAAVVVLDAFGLLEVRGLGTERGVIEPRGDGMRLRDLPEFVLQHHGARAVEDAEGAAGKARGVLAESRSASARLDADQANRRMLQHLVEQ